MHQDTIREISTETTEIIQRLRSIRFLNGLLYFLMFLGMAVLLIPRMDYLLAGWYWLIHVLLSYSASMFLSNSAKLKEPPLEQSVNPLGRKTAGSLNLNRGKYVYIGSIVRALLLYGLFTLLQDPSKSGTAALLMLLAALLSLLLRIIGNLFRPKGLALVEDLFLPVNVILWYLGIVNRMELVWIFGIEAIITLIITIIRWYSFTQDEILNPRKGLLSKMSMNFGKIAGMGNDPTHQA